MRKEREAFPGQVERIDYTVEQANVLASPARAEVFWSFSGDEPRSIAEIANALGKSRGTVTYHVNELARVGLLLAVDERHKRSRTEKLYVYAARIFFTFGPDAPAEYRKLAVGTFASMMRSLVRERAALSELYEYDTAMSAFSSTAILSNRLNEKHAQELASRLREIVMEYAQDREPDPDGVRLSFMYYVGPTLAEVKRAVKEVKEGAGEKRRGSSSNKP